MIDELAATLEVFLRAEQQNNQHARLLAIVGPSGSGKSSAVMAGLLPQLQAGKLPASEKWVYPDPMVPGVHPVESLACTLAEYLPDKSQNMICEDLEDDSTRGLHRLATTLAKHQGTRVVLFVDQFEELFTQTISQEERQCFIDLLVTATTEPRGPVIVILTLRADFYDRLLSYSALGLLIQSHHRVVLPMDIKDLRTVIERPAALPDVQLTFEGDLVGDLLFEVHGQAGALPLLQFTLDQLFQRRREHQLTLQAYHEMGGVKGALAKHAESTYAALPSEEHRRLARALFLRLIEPGATEQDTTRRRAALSELLLPDPKETAIIGEVTSAFTTARLLTSSTLAGTPTLEVSHEALIWEWARLADWLRAAREDIRLQQAISEDAAVWQQHSRPRDRLYRGSQLAEAQAWAKRNIPSSNEMAFLRASALQRIRFFVSMLAVGLVLLSLAGIAVQLALNQPLDPTRVTNLQDNGPGSLRWAIGNAPAGSTITFDERLGGKTIKLTSGDLQITRNLRIQGLGTGSLTISSDTDDKSIIVYKDAVVTISNVTFRGTETGGISSAIINSGTLTLINSTVSGYDTLNISLTNFQAGGITNSGTLTLINSTVADNRSNHGSGGGGILNVKSGVLTLTNSTISRNTSDENGGGISNEGTNAQVAIIFCTIYGNRAGSRGGGIWNGAGNKQLVMSSSIVAGNTARAGPDIAGTLTSNGYNLIQDTSRVIFTPNKQHATDIAVAPHTDLRIDSRLSGQLPQTHALHPGSPAIDRIPLDACQVNTISTDQRGVKRPDGHEDKCDIGAYEYTD